MSRDIRRMCDLYKMYKSLYRILMNFALQDFPQTIYRWWFEPCTLQFRVAPGNLAREHAW
jgi:hypothetical protein